MSVARNILGTCPERALRKSHAQRTFDTPSQAQARAILLRVMVNFMGFRFRHWLAFQHSASIFPHPPALPRRQT